MLYHPYVLEELGKQYRNGLLQQAEAHRKVRLAKKGQPEEGSRLGRVAARLGSVLHGSARRPADQGSAYADEALADAYR